MTTILRGCVGAITSAAVIRALQDHGVRVVGMDSDPRSVGFHLCDVSYLVPPPTDPGYVDRILAICRDEKIDAILPSAEEEILVLTKDAEAFANQGVRLLCPEWKTCWLCADKDQTYRYFSRVGIPMPERHTVPEWDAVLTSPIKFPCIVKPRMGRGGKGVFLVEDHVELGWRLTRDPQLIVQEYIEGPQCAADVLIDWDGTILSLVTRQRYLLQAGSMTKGITRADPEIVPYVERIVADLKLVGPVMFEYIRGPDGPRFIELNTRFGGGGGALSIAADPTIIPNLIRMITGGPREPSHGFTAGLQMLRHYTEVFSEPGGV